MSAPDPRDPREIECAEQGAKPRVRALVQDIVGGIECDLTDEHPSVLRHLALAMSLLVGLRAAACAPVRVDMHLWRIDAATGVLTFEEQKSVSWVDSHAARLVAAGAASTTAGKGTWFDMWDVVPPAAQVTMVSALARLVHAPLDVVRPCT